MTGGAEWPDGVIREQSTTKPERRTVSRMNNFGQLFLGEVRKAFTGSIWYRMLLIGISIASLSVFGYAVSIPDKIAAGIPIENATAAAIRFWFMTLLGSGLFGVVFVAREFSSHSIARSVLLSHSRWRLFWAKTLVCALMGVLYAMVSAVLVLVSLPIISLVSEENATWSGEAGRTLFGIVVVVIISAPWGAVIGWMLRSNVSAVGVFLALTLVVDEGIFRLAPSVGRFTMQISMGAVYRDGKENALSPEWGAFVMGVWLVLGLTAAMITFRRRDVLGQ